MQPIICCHDVYKSFNGGILKRKKKVKALVDINFNIRVGECFGLIGPNGSGKSTLIRILSTLLYPDKGKATICGLDVVTKPYQVRPLISRVSVDAAFFKRLSAWENLRYSARLYGVPLKTAKERALDVLSQLGFSTKRFTDPMEDLSRGMQQKVAVARALINRPQVLLLDEPTTGLDPRSKREVEAYIQKLRSEKTLTIFLTTHDMYEAENLCDRVAIIDKGKIVVTDTPEGLKSTVASKRDKDHVTLEDVFMELTHKEWVDDPDADGEDAR
ncbi:ABC transporter ATP-binding protein [candidate division WOR-3 bacterium]|nr:ABC transporter ATP-binding protein [candidate division WOR-3 bacterium]